ncbi:Cupin [Streptomyces mirabilis]|uniref:Cupin n=1 Tax=Streptomyces mirabilis TaxID=68239 RepID=A0A1I2UC78_9ACTN|nr:Cupin [Streptomyces mirabilis]
MELVPGEVTLVRGGPDHHIGHEPGVECLEPEDFRARHAYDGSSEDLRATIFLCGAYRFSGDIGSGLLEALPQVLTLSAAVGDPLREVIALLSHELTAAEPGQPTVLDRLLDVLLVLAIRNDFRRGSTAPRWYRASADPRLNAALQAMHENAGHPWSVPELDRAFAPRSQTREEVVERGRYLSGVEVLDQEMPVADLAALLRAEKAPQLLLPGPTVVCGLVQEGLPGPQVALGPDDLLDARRAQRADEFILQIRHAHEEAPVRRPGPLQAAVVEALLALVAQSPQVKAKTGWPEETGVVA